MNRVQRGIIEKRERDRHLALVPVKAELAKERCSHCDGTVIRDRCTACGLKVER